MKITKRQLKRIIREEYTRLKDQGLINEAPVASSDRMGRINPETIRLMQYFLRGNPYWMRGPGGDAEIAEMARELFGASQYFMQFDSVEAVEEELHELGSLTTDLSHTRGATKRTLSDMIKYSGFSEQDIRAAAVALKRNLRQ